MRLRIYASLLVLMSFSCGGSPKQVSEPKGSGALGAYRRDGQEIIIAGVAAVKVSASVDAAWELKIKNPNAQINRLATFADAVADGAGLGVHADQLWESFSQSWVGVPLVGIDLNKPVWAMAVRGDGHLEPLIVASLRKSESFEESANAQEKVFFTRSDSQVVIGSEAAIEAHAAQALALSNREEWPERIWMSFDPSRIQAILKEWGFNDKLPVDVQKLVKRVELSFSANHKSAKGELSLLWREGSIRAIAAANPIATYELSRKHGIGPLTLAYAGHFSTELFESLIQPFFSEPAPDYVAATPWGSVGEFTYGYGFRPSVQWSLLTRPEDPAALVQVWKGSESSETSESDAHVIPSFAALKIGESTLGEIAFPFLKSGGSSAMALRKGVYALIVGGKNPKKTSRRALEGQPKGVLAWNRVLSESRALKESFVLMFDARILAGIPAADQLPLVVGATFDERAATFRFDLPTSQTKMILGSLN